ncbi:MAG: hypothetical protein COB23_09410 [Methylophaga sp.]|nr:MAG: hypothetical protein COB23_09410 [Methylophaga sp.]
MNTSGTNLSNQAQKLAESLEQIINSNRLEVPMLPEIANKALLLAQDPDSDASEMAQLIQSDQSLAGHVMNIANSVAYTPMANLVSLQQAISRLGMGVISEIALSAAIGAKMFNTPGYERYIATIWRHALATALWAKEISRHCRNNVEVSFLSGLLHSIGRPAVIQTILEQADLQQFDINQDHVHQLEDTFCQMATESVITSWKMPSMVVEAACCYVDYENAPTAQTQAATVNAGVQFAIHMLNPEVLDREAFIVMPALAKLNLYQEDVEKLLTQMDIVKGRLEGLSS